MTLKEYDYSNDNYYNNKCKYIDKVCLHKRFQDDHFKQQFSNEMENVQEASMTILERVEQQEHPLYTT